MGIKNLWKELKEYTQDGHLGQFSGKRVAVDMYVWLHMATKGCILIDEERLATFFTERRQSSDDVSAPACASSIAVADVVSLSDHYIDRVVARVETLQRFGIIPVCVFDGADIPMKRGTNEKREARRQEAFAAALKLLEGSVIVSGARHHGFQRHAADYKAALELLEHAVDISPEVAHPVIQVLREERHLECIVAPYEADPQLTYLVQTGYVHAAMSEDSDLIAYYCPCVIAKTDFSTGRCSVLLPGQSVPAYFSAVSSAGLGRRQGQLPPLQHHQQQHLRNSITTISAPPSASSAGGASASTAAAGSAGPIPFTYESFLLGCVMSGCDYVQNLPKIGIKTAFRLVSHSQSLPQLLSLLQTEYGFTAETVRHYRRDILEAFYCFAHHIVYCPIKKRAMNLHPLPPGVAGVDGRGSARAQGLRTELVGALWASDVARKVCEECLYDPTTQQLYTGTYQPTLQRYLRRTRCGQTRLNAFDGFEALTAARVVVAGGGVKRQREGGDGGARAAAKQEGTHAAVVSSSLPASPSSASAFFGAPRADGRAGGLPKVQEARGFLGAGGGAARTVVVRSKYFLHADGRQDVRERWSASSSSSSSAGDDEGSENAQGVRRSPDRAGGDDGGSDEATFNSTLGTAGAAAFGAGTTAACAASNTTLGHGLSTPAISELTLGTESPPSLPTAASVHAANSPPTLDQQQQQQQQQPQRRTCSCPFGYVQCDTSHSIFVKCFDGKGWTRGGGSGDGEGGEATAQEAHTAVFVSHHRRSGTDADGASAQKMNPPSAASGTSSSRTSTVTAGAPAADDVTHRATHKPAAPASATYQCGGFKPPRSLGHEKVTSDTKNTPTTASIFEKLAFKKS